jgi:hypothetical protein
MTAHTCVLVLGMLAVLCTATVAVGADTIPIVSGDFESPVITNPPYIYGQIYDQADLPLLLPWVVWQGALTNPTMLDTALPGNGFGIDMTGHGNQVAYIFCGDPDAANRPYWYQNLTDSFEEGKDYTLSMSGAMVEAAANPGQTLIMQLGYWDGAENGSVGPTIVAERLIDSTEISSSWGEYSFSSGVISGAAVGKPIVVYIGQGNNPYVTGPQYYFDNVQLSSVPEPGTIGLLASGLLGLMANAWRKRK